MKVLSIDIDFIIEDFHNERFDNDLMPWFKESHNSWDYWRNVEYRMDTNKLNFNKGSFEFIERVFKQSLTLDPQVVFILDHHDIYQFLKDEEELEVVNFDAHHDIVTVDNNMLHEGSWGYLLWDKVKSWTWVKNKTSNNSGSKIVKKGDPKLKVISKEEFQVFEPDFIAVCLSPTYIHPKFWWMYNQLKDFYNDYKYGSERKINSANTV